MIAPCRAKRLAATLLLAVPFATSGCATLLQGELDPVTVTVDNPPPHYTVTVTGDGEERTYDDHAQMGINLHRWPDYQVILTSPGRPESRASFQRGLNPYLVLDFAVMIVSLGLMAQAAHSNNMQPAGQFFGGISTIPTNTLTNLCITTSAAGAVGLLTDLITGNATRHTPADLHLSPTSMEKH